MGAFLLSFIYPGRRERSLVFLTVWSSWNIECDRHTVTVKAFFRQSEAPRYRRRMGCRQRAYRLFISFIARDVCLGTCGSARPRRTPGEMVFLYGCVHHIVIPHLFRETLSFGCPCRIYSGSVIGVMAVWLERRITDHRLRRNRRS